MAERIDLSPADYARRLMNAQTRFGQVEASLSLSYELLNAPMQKQWRMLAVFPDTFNQTAASAVWGLDDDTAQDALSTLVAYSLVEWQENNDRYRLHDLVRLFAEKQRGKDERAVSQFRAGQAWAESNAEKDEAATKLCSDYPDAGIYNLELRQHPRERIRWLEAGLASARRLKRRSAEGAHLNNRGLAYTALGETRKAIEYHEQALVISRELGNHRGEGQTLGNLGNAYYFLGKTRKAMEYYEQDLTITREIGDRRGEGIALGNIGVAY